MLNITFKSQSELDHFLQGNGYKEMKFCVKPSYLDAIIGISDSAQIVYNYEKMVESLAKEYEGQGWSENPYEDAMEWINFNMIQGPHPYPIVIMENPAADTEHSLLFSKINESSFLGSDMNGVYIFDSKRLAYQEYQTIDKYSESNQDFEYKII